MNRVGQPDYFEKLSSRRTEGLFVLLAVLFLGLFTARATARGMDILAVVLLAFFFFFLFYAVNYRVLTIRLTSEALTLRFGIIRWDVDLNNVESCARDHLPKMLEYGGAGVHFMNAGGRYRVSFNFLEYPRVVIRLKKRRGLVRDVSFSTRRPDELIRQICAE